MRKLLDLGRTGGKGRKSLGSGVFGGSHLIKGPGGPSWELDLSLEGSGLHGAFGRAWCDQFPAIWRSVLKGQSRSQGNFCNSSQTTGAEGQAWGSGGQEGGRKESEEILRRSSQKDRY